MDAYDYYILNAAECPEQNLTENYLNEYGEPCFEHFNYNVINKKQIYSTFVVCSFVGNNTFEVDCPYRCGVRSNISSNVKDLKEGSDVEKDVEKDNKEEDSGADEDSDSDDDEIENDRPLVLFKNQVEEVIHSFSDV